MITDYVAYAKNALNVKGRDLVEEDVEANHRWYAALTEIQEQRFGEAMELVELVRTGNGSTAEVVRIMKETSAEEVQFFMDLGPFPHGPRVSQLFMEVLRGESNIAFGILAMYEPWMLMSWPEFYRYLTDETGDLRKRWKDERAKAAGNSKSV